MAVAAAPIAHLVTFAEGAAFEAVAQRLRTSATVAGFATFDSWNWRRIGRTLAPIFAGGGRDSAGTAPAALGVRLPLDLWQRSREAFRWWKPFVVLSRLSAADVANGSWVVWHDSTTYVPNGFLPRHAPSLRAALARLEHAGADALLGTVLPASVGWSWEQRFIPSYTAGVAQSDSLAGGRSAVSASGRASLCAALRRMELCGPSSEADADGDEACCERLRSRPMLCNAWAAFRKTAASLELLREWLRWSLDDEAMQRMPFADQSSLELLAHGGFGAGSRLWVLRAMTTQLGYVSDPARKPVRAGHWSAPGNRLKHLGVALDLLPAVAPGGAATAATSEAQREWGGARAELVPLAPASVEGGEDAWLAEWRERNASAEAWLQSLRSWW